MNVINTIDALPTKNSQLCAFKNAEALSGENVKDNFVVKNPTCHACPVACTTKDTLRVPGGRHVRGKGQRPVRLHYVAICLRWGSYFALLADASRPFSPDVRDETVSQSMT
jgi:hypothetical protein